MCLEKKEKIVINKLIFNNVFDSCDNDILGEKDWEC